jgi:hypothetical protein
MRGQCRNQGGRSVAQVWTGIVTALVAVVVFVVTQSFLKLVLEPIQEQRKLIGEVASALTVYEKAFTLRVVDASGGETWFGASPDEAKEAEKVLRELAGRLRSSLWSVPVYDLFAFIRMVPKLADVVVAADELQMWYSQLHASVNEHQAARIRECRNIISKSLGIEQRLQVIRPPPIPSAEEVYDPTVERKD